LEPLLAPGAPVLDLGCVCGVPVARRLARRHPLTGVDISPVQIERARQNVPTAHFLCADMATLDLAPQSLAAVVSFYTIIHLPLDEQPALLRNIGRWLQPGGYLMATVGHSAWTGQEDGWLGGGNAMYWSHAGEDTYLAWLAAAGLTVLWTRFVPEGVAGHTLILAQKVESTAEAQRTQR
ncbi:MAG TPA: class I SAM-dependent methyltransferase, partial [Anaerolineae bacterium]|nr:class I SAM-dependent methyltransferase [Anaerolineae bacterium]